MTNINLQKRKYHFSFRIWMQCILWISAVCAMAFVFHKKTAPIYTREYLNSVLPSNTPVLTPGESASQSFRSSYDRLYSVGIAVSYQDDMPEDASLLIQVLSGETLAVEQPLSVLACPNSGFLTLSVDLRNCQGETITIRIENTSPSSENAVFSLLATNKSYLYLDNADNYLLNGEEQNARLLFVSSYITGHSYYRALTYSFWVFLLALIASRLISKSFYPGQHKL